MRRTIRVLAFIPLLVLAACSSIPRGDSSKVKVTQSAETVRVEIAGKLFTEYHYKDVVRPYFYPLLGPGDVPMTRKWPLEASTDEEHDHPHHRSLWYAHGEVNGHNFWSEEGKYGKIVHDGFTGIRSTGKSAEIKSKDKWVASDGTVICTDDRLARFSTLHGARIVDFEVTLHASNGDLNFQDTKEGTMALRLREPMRLKKPGQGHIVNSEGVKDDATWGKPANWVDYHGPLSGKTMGIAMLDHPENPRHPTTWHVRDYGLFAANPFGLHDFEKKPAHTGDFKIPAGQSATFRYRIILHEGDEKQADIAGQYSDYVKGLPANQ